MHERITRNINDGRCIRRRAVQIGGRIPTARGAAHGGAAIPVVWWLTPRAASAEFFHGLPLSPCQDRGREASSTTKTCARAQRARDETLRESSEVYNAGFVMSAANPTKIAGFAGALLQVGA